MEDVKKGDRFIWKQEVHIEVTRVSTEGLWADIRCWAIWDPGQHLAWTRRVDLPLPDTYVPWKQERV